MLSREFQTDRFPNNFRIARRVSSRARPSLAFVNEMPSIADGVDLCVNLERTSVDIIPKAVIALARDQHSDIAQRRTRNALLHRANRSTLGSFMTFNLGRLGVYEFEPDRLMIGAAIVDDEVLQQERVDAAELLLRANDKRAIDLPDCPKFYVCLASFDSEHEGTPAINDLLDFGNKQLPPTIHTFDARVFNTYVHEGEVNLSA